MGNLDAFFTNCGTKKLNALQTQVGDMPPDEVFASERALVNCLVFVGGERAGETVVLGAEPLTIGRGAGCDLRLDDPTASRNHATVTLHGSIAEVNDLGSMNGTYVNNVRLECTGVLDPGALFQVGEHVMRFTMRSREEVRAADAQAADLNRATKYVRSLLPAKVERGPVILDWEFAQCANLGGDIFGYRTVGDKGSAVFIIDVSGQGIGSAMHATAIHSLLNQEELPGVDLTNPAKVLTFLNQRFRMEDHQGLCFNIWYGYYDHKARRLTYSCGGHHPSYLVAPDRQHMVPLHINDPMLGAFPSQRYQAAVIDVPRSWNLFMFSDGAFDIIDRNNRAWTISDFEQLISEPGLVEPGEPARLFAAVRQDVKPGPLQDDCSIVTLTFV